MTPSHSSSTKYHLPLIVITGPTASGKTTLAIELAERYGGEIVCADSRTVYKNMDIGTAKPTAEERKRIPHWGIDLVEPGVRFTVADFKRYAEQKIEEIRARGHIPLLVGGTGLYVDAVLFNYQFGGEVDAKRRVRLDRMTIDELKSYCAKNNVHLPENEHNKRYLVRTIERGNTSGRRAAQPTKNCIIVGIATTKMVLEDRIKRRSEQLFENGVVKEATILGKKYDWKNEAMTGSIYPICKLYLDRVVTLEQAKEKFTTLDRRLAKRQMTWLQRNPFIEWVLLTETKEYIGRQLACE